jgi:hypothetical protein
VGGTTSARALACTCAGGARAVLTRLTGRFMHA